MNDVSPKVVSLSSPTDPDPTRVDVDTLGHQRTRRLAAGILTALISRGTAAVAPLLLIPITLNYLGSETYGLWMAVAALTSMALWADLGLGNGLLTKLAPCCASGDWASARRYVSTTYAVLSATACTLVAVLWGSSRLVPWAAVFNVTNHQLDPVARAVALICFTAFLVNIPLSLVQRVQFAYQQVAQSNLWQGAGSLLSVGLAWGAVRAELHATSVIAAAVSGPLLANVANTLWLYAGSGQRLRPRLRFVDRSVVAPLFRLGGQFLILSIVTSIAMNVDNLVIAAGAVLGDHGPRSRHLLRFHWQPDGVDGKQHSPVNLTLTPRTSAARCPVIQ